MIEPFKIPLEAVEVEWILQRVAAYRWPPEPSDAGWRYGANQAYLKRLSAYWLNDFDWAEQVTRLNQWPHFRASFGGAQLHFVHRRSSRADAVPLLISHGWPSSVFEFQAIIDRLAEPDDVTMPAFHVIAPSLPGYAWSPAPQIPIGPRAIAKLYNQLMTETLGYNSYIAQGGDWGSLITAWLGLDASACRAIHLNGYGLASADMTPRTDAEKAWVRWSAAMRKSEMGYLILQGTKPQSLAYAIMDSPMGVAAWLCEKYCGWSDGSRGDSDPPFAFDDVLTQVMIYLTTRSFSTSTWLYRGYFDESPHTLAADMKIHKPVGVAAFPFDLLKFPPRSMVERSYHVVHWTDMPRGGHFAAWESPDLLVDDLRVFALSMGRI
jgi:Epoxide hydrolase N terminus